MVYLALPGELVAVVDRGLPVAGLLLQVKSQAGGASDLLETLTQEIEYNKNVEIGVVNSRHADR